jgi:hypothetical protein
METRQNNAVDTTRRFRSVLILGPNSPGYPSSGREERSCSSRATNHPARPQVEAIKKSRRWGPTRSDDSLPPFPSHPQPQHLFSPSPRRPGPLRRSHRGSDVTGRRTTAAQPTLGKQSGGSVCRAPSRPGTLRLKLIKIGAVVLPTHAAFASCTRHRRLCERTDSCVRRDPTAAPG